MKTHYSILPSPELQNHYRIITRKWWSPFWHKTDIAFRDVMSAFEYVYRKNNA